MNLSALSRIVGAVQLAAKTHAPTIMVTTGVASMGASVIIASKKTLTVEAVVEPHVADLEKIQQGENLELDSYSADAARGDRLKVYSRTALALGKHYWVPGVLFVGGAGLVFGGHHILLKRNATLAVAFTGLQQAFENYRQKVRDEYGPEVDQALVAGTKSTISVDPVTGEIQTVTERDLNTDLYNRVFERGATTQWENDLGVNRMFISHQQAFAQERLMRRGHLYLSEVYEALGFPESDISRVCGWKVRTLPDGSRDIPAVDFGLNKPHIDDDRLAKEKAIYLDFNCQGLIVGGQIQKAIEKA